jgi:hypothetical protein
MGARRGPNVPPEMRARRAKILRIVAIIAVAPSVLLVVIIGIFVARSELAHDESTCPFRDVGERPVIDGVTVLEQMRRCQDGVEERRWIVLRGPNRREIGRRRLHQPLYEPERYSWSAEMRDGFVHIDITNSGIDPAEFREGPE